MATPLRLLILDRPADTDLMLQTLRQEGFAPSWQCVQTETDYLAHLNDDLTVILAEYTLPQLSALRALDLLRERGLDIPFIVVTRTMREEEAVACLKQGAADYVLKDRLVRLGPAVMQALHDKERRNTGRGAGSAQLSREDALRASEARFRLLITQNVDGVVVVGRDGMIQFVNPAAEVLFARPAVDLVGQPFGFPVVIGETIELDIVRRADDMTVAEMRMVETEWEGEQASLASLRDISERKRAEAALRQQRDWFDTTLSSIGDAVVATDTDGQVTYFNRAAEELTGWSTLLATGRSIADVVPLLQEQTREPLAHPVHNVLQHEIEVEVEPHTVLLTRDGRECPVLVSVAPICGETEPQRGVVVVLRDMTERRQLEERLRQSQKIKAVGTLAGGIAHDFNNILAIMTSFTQVALSKQLQQEPIESYLQEVLTAAKRGKELVQQILVFSHQRSPERTLLPLQQLVQETLTLLRATLPATISIRSEVNTTSDWVLANSSQLRQVMMSLCSNAEYAMRDSGGALELGLDTVDITPDFIEQHPELKLGPHVRLAVRDTGPGIAPEHLPRIFEPFFSTKNVHEGTGMGLAVAHGIVSGHDGLITVKSLLGSETTFEIYLPQQAAPVALSTDGDDPSRLGQSRQGHILFVDDEESLVVAAEFLLTDLGYEVSVYTNSQEALDAFEAAANTYDLVIADQTMPQLTGKELAEAVRSLRPDIPVILCTGYSHVIDAAEAEDQGIDAFLMKPVDIDVLADTIQRVLSRSRDEHTILDNKSDGS